jgi:hypothetical protein
LLVLARALVFAVGVVGAGNGGEKVVGDVFRGGFVDGLEKALVAEGDLFRGSGIVDERAFFFLRLGKVVELFATDDFAEKDVFEIETPESLHLNEIFGPRKVIAVGGDGAVGIEGELFCLQDLLEASDLFLNAGAVEVEYLVGNGEGFSSGEEIVETGAVFFVEVIDFLLGEVDLLGVDSFEVFVEEATAEFFVVGESAVMSILEHANHFTSDEIEIGGRSAEAGEQNGSQEGGEKGAEAIGHKLRGRGGSTPYIE